MKDFQKQNPILKDNFNSNKFPQNKKTPQENVKFSEKAPKKNLPELRLTKLKIRPVTNPDQNNTQNKINTKTGLKYTPLIPKFQKNHSSNKKTELMFPKIKNNPNSNFHYEQEHNIILSNYNSNNIIQKNNENKSFSTKRKNIHSQRSSKTKALYGSYDVNNPHIDNNNINNINNINRIQDKTISNAKSNFIEKNNMENNNYMVNLQKVKSKIPKHPRGNKSMPSKIITKNKKPSKLQNEKNIIDSLTIQPLIKYPKNDNFIGKNNFLGLNDQKSKNNNLQLANHNESTTLNNFRSTPSPLPTTNSYIDYDLMDERLNFLHDLFSSLTSLTGGPNPFFNINQTQKTVELSPEIFRNTYKNFVPSITSNPVEFSEGDIIKGYAQNSSQGNIRDYNEDTITTTKITLDNGEQFYFFGVYDGHGGKGCSLYLQKNLHSHIKEFSKDGIKKAIDEVEEQFEKTEALDEKGEIKDQSGSCGIMTIIQKNKCIIANVGDSRLVVFKNNSLFFCTEDHKPDSAVEKERINKAGGSIYQTPSLFPLYQNGKKIDIPWRVLPGRLSVSRTFGDIEAKSEKFGGNRNVVATLPDITEIDLNEEFNLIVLGCDGIFDVLSNEEILECIKYVLKEKNVKEINDEVNMSELCGDFAAMIIKSALAKDSFDNVSCVVIAINIKDLLNN